MSVLLKSKCFLLQDSLSAGAERKLPNVRQEEVFGSGTAKRHRRWKRSALRTKQLHGLTDQELSILDASQFKVRVQDQLNCFVPRLLKLKT